jgi:hypothetical protein
MNHTIQKPSLSVSHSEFEDLARFQDLYCISICLPSSSNNHIPIKQIEDEIFKQADLGQYSSQQQYGLTREAVWEHLKEVKKILDLCHQKEPELSLIILISRVEVKSFFIPLTREFDVYVNDHFYLKPLTQLFNDDRKLMILHLQKEKAELVFEKNTLAQNIITIENRYPENLDTKDFFENVNLKLHNLDKGKVPWILAGDKALTHSFLNGSKYENLFQHILDIPEGQENQRLLRRKAWRLLTEYQEEKVNQYISQFTKNASDFNLSSDLDEIVLQAFQGKVKTLFLTEGKDVYGEFDAKNDFVLSNLPQKEGASLSNLAAVYTSLNKGNVYHVDVEKMPFSQKPMNAIFTQKTH